jgi:hypothetical protein
MVTVRVELTDEEARQLQDLAGRLGTSVEVLARLGLRQSLLAEDEEFLRVAEEVLEKNAELYRRLA